ncbi:FAD binding domain protein [Colletotrichum karsti]|uniref:FAD binding domain protein n=1 Tax=Colletotrichum karsti TaxID=1095194 RepID=A0A9P6HX62_9PEZI|nr:FAD binding domain protein [Colletotrichum karsti]KAF9870656.1 FAD binding domain protein [Colletotrichum karsti]
MHSLLTFTVSVLALGGVVLADDCKCTPSEPCWPSPSNWESFNNSIAGRLIRTVPPASVCYPSETNYDNQACEAVIANWTTWTFHSADAASVPNPSSLNACDPIYPNGTSITGDPEAGTKGCSLGALPPYVVNATDSNDIQQALVFANQHNLRLSIKNTGHSGAGRIWTHHLKQAIFHDKFQPQLCSSNSTWKGSQMAITVGAGIQDGELYDFAKKNSVVAVGGTNMDVGVVGWATGGGHGHLTGEYGMGADNIIEATLVTTSGTVVVANACQNQDLFWAIRGGGGGTFGVIVNMTVKAYPEPKMILQGFNIALKNGTSSKDWWRFVAELHSLLPALQDQGIKGYYTMGGPPSSQTISLAGSLVAWNMQNSTVSKAMTPLQQLISQYSDTVTGSVQVVPIPSFYDLLTAFQIPEHAGGSGISAARLISRQTVTQNQGLLAKVLEEIGPKAVAPLDGTPNPSISGTMTISHEPVDNALNPAWRDSVAHLIVSQSWADSLPKANVSQIVNDMTYNKLNVLRGMDPTTGTYLNEANVFEPGWQWSFFGPNYGRLRSIKDKYDPDGLLWCPQCVGSEDWIQGKDGKLCKAYEPFL